MKRAGPRRLVLILMTAIAIPVIVLSWLGLRALRQDRELERQEHRERLEVLAGRVALEIERELQEVDDALAAGGGVHFLTTGIESGPTMPILYQPIETPLVPGPDVSMAVAEREEFQRRDLAAAEREYARLAGQGPPADRAAALVGLGRVRRSRRDYDGSLEAFARLEGFGRVAVAGQPAALVAAQARCRTLEAAGDLSGLRVAAKELADALAVGQWPVDQATFSFYQDLVRQWHGTPPPTDAVARTDVAVELWRWWRRGSLPLRGRRLLTAPDGQIVLAVWASNGDSLRGWFGSTADVEQAWRPHWEARGLRVTLSTPDGQPFVGTPENGDVSLSPGETHLPLIVSAATRAPEDSALGRNSSVLISGLVVAFTLLAAAAYALYRGTSAELAVSQRQADFVSAVSHEFRTPLTSMRHLIDLLASRTQASDARKAQYYELLANETNRLHRLVDSLLSFGQVDGDAYLWQLESTDLGRLVREVADHFQRDLLGANRAICCEVETGLPLVRADREALTRALWNLLENAGKYSEPDRPIRVSARHRDAQVYLSVTDEGPGIPAAEQQRIFQKFVRGADAIGRGVRGVGIGLALVTRIVEAHGGTVQLQSQPGHGSTFTLVIPCLES